MTNFINRMSNKRKRLIAIPLSILLVFLIGILDYQTGYELSFFIFYIFPVSLAAWFVGLSFGLFISLASLLIWLYADNASGHTYSEPWIQHWNGGVRLTFFIMFTYLLAQLKKRFNFEKNWARTDNLTGALNGRGFRDKLEFTLPFAARTKTSFAIAFIDLDNFKKVNDTMGHAVGDLILKRTVATMKKHLRETDYLGRMGGDEFIIFLPATDESGAQIVLKNMREKLLEEAINENWHIGYSIGVLTLNPNDTPVPHYQDLVNYADKLMYNVKNSGKNNIIFKDYKADNRVP